MIIGTVIVLIGCDTYEPPELIICSKGPAGPVTAKVGRTEYGSLYELGSVVIEYSEATQQRTNLTDTVPSAAVNDFFLDRGYTPRVMGSYLSAEVIYIGEDVNTEPMLKKLERNSSVKAAYLHYLVRAYVLLETNFLSMDWNRRPVEKATRAIIEVGKLEDGSLYELGVVLVLYDATDVVWKDGVKAYIAPVERVNDFFLSKGYMPKDRSLSLSSGIAVIHIGECVDPAPMLKELKTIPGVINARLNILYNMLTVSKGENVIDFPYP